MNEVNAIVTSGGAKTPRASCCPDAKREDDKTGEISAAALPGRVCPSCWGTGAIKICGGLFEKFARCKACQGTGERSGPGNAESTGRSSGGTPG